MSFRRLLPLFVIGLLVIAAPISAIAQEGGPAQPAAPLSLPGTGFTYQGELTSGGTLVTAACDFQFSLWNARNNFV